MMLRTTISRLRKVCSIGFIPRILRGDPSATVTSAVIRKANKSTKATGDGENASTDNSNDVLPDCRYASTAELDGDCNKKIDEDAGLKDETANNNEQTILTPSLPLTHRERCQKIIDEAFGNVSYKQHDKVLGEQYFSHTVNLEDTRRMIHESEKAKLKLQEQALDGPLLPDSRTHYSIFNMSRELNVKDDKRDEIIVTDSAPASEPDLSKNLENVKGTTEETPLVEEPNLSQAKEDFDKCINNPESIKKKALCDDDDDAETIEVIKDERKPYLSQKITPAHQLPWFLRAPTEKKPESPLANEDVNDNQESVEKKPLFDDDAETIKLVKDEGTHDLHQEGTSSDQPHTPHVLNTTTAKEEEELLTQKLETIEETPVVEAQKPKLEGFNVTPRVLGNDPTFNCKNIENDLDKSSRLDFPEAIDEVSKRCLNCPLGMIDEMLINEMEKLGMTCRIAHKAPSTPMEDDLVQMDVLNKQPIGIIEDQEIMSENPELEEEEDESATDSRIPEENEQTEALRKPVAIIKPTEEDAKDILYPNNIRIQIEPKACLSGEYNPADTCVPIMSNQSEGPLSLYGTIHKGILLETPNSHAFKNNNNLNAEPCSVQSVEEDDFDVTSQNAKTESAAVKEETMPAEHINIASADSINEASDNTIVQETHLIPEYSTCLQSVEQDDFDVTSQNAKTESAAAKEETMPAEHININIASADSINEASDNTIVQETHLTPEYSTCLQSVEQDDFDVTSQNAKTESAAAEEETMPAEVSTPSYYATMNASKSVGDETGTPADRQIDNLGNDHKVSALTNENVHQTFAKETDEVEHYCQTPTQESTTEVQGELQENQNPANSLFVNVPNTNFSIPSENCNKKGEYSPTDTVTQQCSKPEGNPEKVNLPEEILKEHTLDPYYVLTCNETCPISPGPSKSRNKNSDFVDTTETLYMKKNVCESVRPKPQPTVKSANVSSDAHARTNVLQLENEPGIQCTSVPGVTESGSKSKVKVGEQMALSALLKKVRERSRFSCNRAQSGLEVEAAGKCRKSPRCQPTGPRSPPTDPIPLPTFGLPKLKRGPPVCKPVKKPSNKCSSCTTNNGGNHPVMPNVLDETEVCAVISKVNLTDEVIDRLQNLGKTLGGVLRQAKSNIEMLLAKDYEPWTPIPSWKIPRKTEKKEWRPGMHGLPPCVDGCPIFPKARASMHPDPPCDLKPCKGFPKRRSFSMLDCFTVALGKNKVYDLGEF